MGSGDVEKAQTYCSYAGNEITATDFATMSVGANYSISDTFVTVTDSSGNVLLTNIFRSPFTNYREVSMCSQKSTWEQDEAGNLLPICDGIAQLADGKNTVTVTLQLSTGEKLVAYTGTLLGS